MTRIRFANVLRIPDGEYELLNIDDNGRFVVRDEAGDTFIGEQSGPHEIEVKCDLCGKWAPMFCPPETSTISGSVTGATRERDAKTRRGCSGKSPDDLAGDHIVDRIGVWGYVQSEVAKLDEAPASGEVWMPPSTRKEE